jgi:putative pyrroloquinoline-quinone-binding quinoprotein
MWQSDGQVAFAYATQAPMAFQPALAGGRLFTGTSNGRLIYLNLGRKEHRRISNILFAAANLESRPGTCRSAYLGAVELGTEGWIGLTE